jgi:hypothetical protein
MNWQAKVEASFGQAKLGQALASLSVVPLAAQPYLQSCLAFETC